MSDAQANRPTGFCGCGCGTATKFDQKKKAYNAYAPGHWARRNFRGPDFLEEDRGFESPCWIWQRAIDPSTGYGRTTLNGCHIGAHRAAYIKAHGAVPGGHEIHHRCAVGECVNPAHLEALRRDAHAQSCPDPRSKLTADQVREIRARAAAMPCGYKRAAAVLAPEYGVSKHCVVNVIRRMRWRNI